MTVEPLTARPYQKGKSFTWHCLACQTSMRGPRRQRWTVIVDAALHNGQVHGDGLIATAEGKNDPIVVMGADCDKCGRALSATKAAGVETYILKRGLMLELPVSVTPADMTDRVLACPNCRALIEQTQVLTAPS